MCCCPPSPAFWYHHYLQLAGPYATPNYFSHYSPTNQLYHEPLPPWMRGEIAGDPPVIPSEYRISKNTPTVNPALASETMPKSMRWDVRYPPRSDLGTTIYDSQHKALVLCHATSEIDFYLVGTPWSLKLPANAHQCVTVGAFLDGLYNMLQQPILDSEWGFIMLDSQWENNVVAWGTKRRRSDHTCEKYYKRIDFMADTTVFKGIGMDRKYLTLRQTPGGSKAKDVFTVKFGKA